MSQADVFVSGQMQEYIANIEFSLNFEDPKKLTTKVRVGDIVFFDGTMAKHVNKITGEEKSGKASPLKSAITNNWLSLNVEGARVIGPINVRTDKIRDNIVYKNPDYDPLKGGSFDDFLKNSQDITIAGTNKKYITEEDQIVKKTDFVENTPSTTKKTGKLEVVGDQVNVKDIGTTVASSTSTVIQKTHTTKVTQAEDGQADHVIVKGRKVTAAESIKNKNTYTVDSSTPAVPEGATMSEVKRATVKFDGTQDARVIKKIGSKMPEEPTEVEGIVLKKTDFSGKPTAGSTPVADLSGVKTQAEVDQIEKTFEKKETPVAGKNYIDMLPEDWSGMHWVKKEKFILGITDPEFLKFIMKVESIKAVHAACRKRLTELAGQAKN